MVIAQKIAWLPSTISVRSMMGYLSLLLLNYFMVLSSSQLVQPRRLIERILALHENSNRLIAREDSMSLYVDISEANKYPSRDDLHMRVFNKDRNVTVCDRKMAEFVHLEKFPCNFAASEAQLQHGVNRFEFEVYSILDGKRYASQEIPDIHLFDHYLYEGYYDNFYVEDQLQSYASKILLATLSAVVLAHAIDAGPTKVKIELNRLIMHQVKLPLVAISTAAADILITLLSGTSRFFQFFCNLLLKLISTINGGLIAHLNAMLGFTGERHMAEQFIYFANYTLLAIIFYQEKDPAILFFKFISQNFLYL